MNCRFSTANCIREYSDCENCKVPNAFGFYAVTNGAKMTWEQRFITESHRAARLARIDAEIEKLNKERQAVLEQTTEPNI